MGAKENLALWDEHIRGEFVEKDAALSLSTMVEDASVLTVPTGWGGTGKDELLPLYRDEFIPSIPPSWTHTTTHRVAPTGKTIEFDIVLIVDFRDGKMAAERIYWDQASVLRQIGQL